MMFDEYARMIGAQLVVAPTATLMTIATTLVALPAIERAMARHSLLEALVYAAPTLAACAVAGSRVSTYERVQHALERYGWDERLMRPFTRQYAIALRAACDAGFAREAARYFSNQRRHQRT